MFNFNFQYPYPIIDRVTYENGTRFYLDPITNHKLPSVTTILSATSLNDFSQWEERVGMKAANQQRKIGTDIGSLVHDHLEKHILSEARIEGNNIIHILARNMADVIINNGLNDFQEIWGTETALYFPELFAGTTDVMGIYNNKQSIIDFKTSKTMKSKDKIIDYRDQLAAYKIAHDHMYNTDIEQGVILMVSRDLKFEKFIYSRDEMEAGCESFLNRVASYYG